MQGNIRIMPEAPSLEMSHEHEPTERQYATIRKAIDELLTKNGKFFIEFSDGSKSIASRQYSESDSTAKILTDIQHFYKSGSLPMQSELSKFRFALSEDSEGRTLTKEQGKFFNDSKIVDRDGRLLTVYHGSNEYGGISVFKKGKIGYLGGGIYLTTDKQYAERYANKNGYKGRIYEAYLNVTNPLTVTSVTPAQEILRSIYDSDRVYKNRTEQQDSATHIITPADIKKLQAKGYDGIVWDYGGSKEISVFDSNQIKLTTNTKPTNSPDIRFALSESTVETDAQGKYLSIKLDSEAQQELLRLSSQERSKFIKEHIQKQFRGIEFTLTDGKVAVVTKSGAGKIASTQFLPKQQTALELNKLIEIAEFNSTKKEVEHKKFTQFDYYTARVKVGKELYSCVVNVGTTKTGGLLQIYDINQFENIEKGTPTRKSVPTYAQNNEFELVRSVPNADGMHEGNPTPSSANAPHSIRHIPSINSILENDGNVNPKNEESLKNKKKYALKNDGDDKIRNFSKGQRAKFVANNTKRKVYSKTDATEVINSIIEERLVFTNCNF